MPLGFPRKLHPIASIRDKSWRLGAVGRGACLEEARAPERPDVTQHLFQPLILQLPWLRTMDQNWFMGRQNSNTLHLLAENLRHALVDDKRMVKRWLGFIKLNRTILFCFHHIAPCLHRLSVLSKSIPAAPSPEQARPTLGILSH